MHYHADHPIITKWQDQGKKIVLVTGIFDILHIEHIRFLKKAKAAGDKLIAGIESDARVRQIKGSHRPVNSETIRLEQLSALKSVDLAFILPQDFSTQSDWEQFMQTLKPAVYAVSSHTSYLENKQKISEKFNIDFQIVHQFNPDISTTKIYQQLTQEV